MPVSPASQQAGEAGKRRPREAGELEGACVGPRVCHTPVTIALGVGWPHAPGKLPLTVCAWGPKLWPPGAQRPDHAWSEGPREAGGVQDRRGPGPCLEGCLEELKPASL